MEVSKLSSIKIQKWRLYNISIHTGTNTQSANISTHEGMDNVLSKPVNFDYFSTIFTLNEMYNVLPLQYQVIS